ncbi:hypothetical protein LIA77_01655 [Sarocladium implicatum]|nr:hypothetical protein LIA77_01655 [Sarocladium implicatum]
MFPSSWALVALLHASLALTQSTTTGTTSATATADPDCEASLITTLCDYKEPESPFAVASSGKEHCWGYCDSHQPCNYVVFVAGNPYTGTGTCWLYPGEEYDPSAGTQDGCSRQVFEVYAKPTCKGGSTPTETGAAGCEATNSPSPIAEVCDYPPPDEQCFDDCYASSGSTHCLSLCAEKDECAFAIFNALNDAKSPYASGNCWVYPKGSFDKSKAGTCDGKPDQFVYKNVCPKPKPTKASTTAAPKETGNGSKGKSDDSDKSGDTKGEGGDDENATADQDAQEDSSSDKDGKKDDDEDAASSLNALPLAGLMAMGLALFL